MNFVIGQRPVQFDVGGAFFKLFAKDYKMIQVWQSPINLFNHHELQEHASFCRQVAISLMFISNVTDHFSVAAVDFKLYFKHLLNL